MIVESKPDESVKPIGTSETKCEFIDFLIFSSTYPNKSSWLTLVFFLFKIVFFKSQYFFMLILFDLIYKIDPVGIDSIFLKNVSLLFSVIP